MTGFVTAGPERSCYVRPIMSGGSWHSFPLDGEPGRRFFGKRLGLLALLNALGAATFAFAYAWNEVDPLSWDGLVARFGVFTLVRWFLPAFVNASLGLLCRYRDFSLDALHTFDVLLAIGGLTGVACNAVGLPPSERPHLFVATGCTYFLLGRAALLPSSARRTFVVGLVALASVPALVYFNSFIQEPARAGHDLRETLVYAAEALFFSTLASKVMYGLARRVEEARKLGQYTLVEKIGEGGMGEVYRASHAMLRRPTAVKLLPPQRNTEQDIEHFEREVQLTSQLCHPNTIQIFDFGRADDGTFYYAMEYLDGLNLDELVRTDGAQPAGRVARLLADVCASLAEAHEAGLVHRDIKPQNIMLCARGGGFDVIKVLDFGLVRSLLGSATQSTSSGVLAGTPAYMAPETITDPKRVDGRSDLYAVGALAYFLLTGSHVFHGETLLVMLGKHLHEPPEPPSQRTARHIPAAFEQLVLACLAKSPAARPASARDLRSALLAIADAEGTFDSARWWREHPRTKRIPQDVSIARTLLATRPMVR
ncbi:MAG TPA: serine/threonine-protein kinase [Polyangiales bacterium]